MRRNTGFSLIEVLVTLVILSVGLLGLAGLITLSQRSESESYQRRQALILLEDMVNRIKSNGRSGTTLYADCYAVSADPSSDYLGTDHAMNTGAVSSLCTISSSGSTATTYALIVQDLKDWNNALLGAAESNSGGSSIGAITGARGCISNSATGVYHVAIAWTGIVKGVGSPPATETCGKSQYTDDSYRRVVSAYVYVPTLR